jgi:hypothetical protein
VERDTIFISHATPDDNDFVRWLGTRLTGHGYRVWADLFELRGGTPFWNSIEEALRHHACKVIFIVSKMSIDPNRTGIRNELSVADVMRKTLNDPGFIIPLRIDDTAFGDFPIQIHQLNGIDFSKGWGAKLVDLLDTLEHANVPKSAGDQTAEFEKWRNTVVRTATAIELNQLAGVLRDGTGEVWRNRPQHIADHRLVLTEKIVAIIHFDHRNGGKGIETPRAGLACDPVVQITNLLGQAVAFGLHDINSEPPLLFPLLTDAGDQFAHATAVHRTCLRSVKTVSDSTVEILSYITWTNSHGPISARRVWPRDVFHLRPTYLAPGQLALMVDHGGAVVGSGWQLGRRIIPGG